MPFQLLENLEKQCERRRPVPHFGARGDRLGAEGRSFGCRGLLPGVVRRERKSIDRGAYGLNNARELVRTPRSGRRRRACTWQLAVAVQRFVGSAAPGSTWAPNPMILSMSSVGTPFRCRLLATVFRNEWVACPGS